MNATVPNLPLPKEQVPGVLARGFAVCSSCRRVHGPANAERWLSWSQPPMCKHADCHARLILPQRNAGSTA